MYDYVCLLLLKQHQSLHVSICECMRVLYVYTYLINVYEHVHTHTYIYIYIYYIPIQHSTTIYIVCVFGTYYIGLICLANTSNYRWYTQHCTHSAWGHNCPISWVLRCA